MGDADEVKGVCGRLLGSLGNSLVLGTRLYDMGVTVIYVVSALHYFILFHSGITGVTGKPGYRRQRHMHNVGY
jgi:hypothetical protein